MSALGDDMSRLNLLSRQASTVRQRVPRMIPCKLQDADGNWVSAYMLEEDEDDDPIAPLGERLPNIPTRSSVRSPSRRPDSAASQNMQARGRKENIANRRRGGVDKH